MDKSAVAALLEELSDHARAGNVSSGQAHVQAGVCIVTIRLRRGHRVSQIAPNRARRVALWMLNHRTLARADVFERCPDIRRSARVHSAALKLLAASGRITKDRGLWIWNT